MLATPKLPLPSFVAPIGLSLFFLYSYSSLQWQQTPTVRPPIHHQLMPTPTSTLPSTGLKYKGTPLHCHLLSGDVKNGVCTPSLVHLLPLHTANYPLRPLLPCSSPS